MVSPLSQYLCDQPFFKVLQGLYYSTAPRHLRELARDYSLSPSGVSDILRRLRKLNLVREEQVKNRKVYSLTLSDGEAAFLEQLFRLHQNTCIETRAPRFEKFAAEKLQWMDEAYLFFKRAKELNADSS
ncbi:winged helix-turn-helix domain-containing protein [bacterium]|nr:winged helix-turn-helix domain-containing protein [bacterium]